MANAIDIAHSSAHSGVRWVGGEVIASDFAGTDIPAMTEVTIKLLLSATTSQERQIAVRANQRLPDTPARH